MQINIIIHIEKKFIKVNGEKRRVKGEYETLNL